MGNVACLPTGATHPDAILEMARGKTQEVLVVGIDHDGDLWFSGSTETLERAHWLLTLAAQQVLQSAMD